MGRRAVPDSSDWQRRWTIDAGAVALEPVTCCMAQGILGSGPITARFEQGALHDRIPQATGIAIRDIDSGAAAVLPAVWLIIRRADARILGDIGLRGPPDHQNSVEIGYSLAPSARGKGTATATVSALVKRLATIPQIRQITAVTGTSNTASRRPLERQGSHLTGQLAATDEVRCTLNLR